MSSFFEKITKRVEIDSDNWVEIKQLNYGDSRKTMSSAMTMREGDRIGIDPGAVQLEQMVLSIKDWGGPGFDGRPVSRENIMELPTWIGDAVTEAIDEINAPISDDEKKA